MGKKSMLSSYRFDKLLASGVTSSVYRVYKDSVNVCCIVPEDKYLALKAVSINKYIEDCNSITKEYDIICKLNHPNIVKAYALWTNTAIPVESGIWDCMLIDYGVSDLYDCITETGYLDELQCKVFFKQMLDAVAYLHSLNIIHSDIKCENFILMRDDTLKLIDFGFAKPFDPNIKTINGKGTPMYGAPEQVYIQPHKAWTVDIWALGCCLYAMATGLLPFSMRPEDPFPELRTGVIFYSQNSRDICKFISFIFIKDHEKRPTAKDLENSSWLN